MSQKEFELAPGTLPSSSVARPWCMSKVVEGCVGSVACKLTLMASSLPCPATADAHGFLSPLPCHSLAPPADRSHAHGVS
ncbi:unnamed protein product [Closterium sp. NIES-64]|nr:unnamed protein product [Closterium sp. NIES-64]